jgi:tetratricopeptide (TPR) repeat protein
LALASTTLFGPAAPCGTPGLVAHSYLSTTTLTQHYDTTIPEHAIFTPVSANPELAMLQALAEEKRHDTAYAQAETLYLQALARVDRTHEADVAGTLEFGLGLVLDAQQRQPEATEHLQAALQLHSQDDGPQSLIVATDQMALGNVLDEMRRVVEAEPLIAAAVETYTRAYGLSDSMTLRAARRYADLLWEMGRVAEAQTRTRELIERARMELGMKHVETARAFYLMCLIQYTDQQKVEAASSCSTALQVWSDISAGSRDEKADIAQVTGELLNGIGQDAQAEKALQMALDLRRQPPGRPPEIAISAYTLGLAQMRQEKFAKAQANFQRALDLRGTFSKGDDAATADTLQGLAQSYFEQDNLAKARPLFERAFNIRQRVLGEHADTATSGVQLARVMIALRNDAEATKVLKRTLTILERLLGLENDATAEALTLLGAAASDQQDWKDAESYFRLDLQVRRKVHGNEAQETGWSHYRLGKLLSRQKRYTEAESELLQAVAIHTQTIGADSNAVGDSAQLLGEVYGRHNRLALAEPQIRRAWNIRKLKSEVTRPREWSGMCLGLVLQQEHKLREAEAVLRATHDEAIRVASTEPLALMADAHLAYVLLQLQQRDDAQIYIRELNRYCATPTTTEITRTCRSLASSISQAANSRAKAPVNTTSSTTDP